MTHYHSDLEWRRVKGFEAYEIRKDGLVRSSTGHILKSWIDSHGYYMVSLGGRKRKRTVGVHRLLAENFIENPTELPEVNHINGIKTDNNLCNLEWVTHAENMQHAYDTGLNKRGTVVKLTHEPTEATFEFRSMSKASEFVGRNRSFTANRKNRGLSLSCGEWAVYIE